MTCIALSILGAALFAGCGDNGDDTEESPARLPAAGEKELSFQDKLEALEEARDAGVFSEKEFEQKKAELMASQSRPLDEKTREKLEALEKAYKAGVFSEEEYKQKMADLGVR